MASTKKKKSTKPHSKKSFVAASTFALGLASGVGVSHANFFVNDTPTSSVVLKRDGYTLSYDQRTKNPLWVHETLTAQNLAGRVSRETAHFKEDPDIPKIFRSSLEDYKGSGYDRGHLAPAANHTRSESAMADTFYLSNMCPQHAQLNRGYWAQLEKYVRDLTKEFVKVEVFSGPLFIPQEDAKGNRFVAYPLIGANDVAVPTHFFKIIIKDDKDVEAYILPNKEIEARTTLDKFKSTAEKIERYAGIKFVR